MKLKQSKLKFQLKIYVDGKRVSTSYSQSKKRFYHKLMRINWKNNPSVYCLVRGGEFVKYRNETIEIYNDGFFTNKHDLINIFKEFSES